LYSWFLPNPGSRSHFYEFVGKIKWI
jgi:hypothetical protein